MNALRYNFVADSIHTTESL